MENKENKPLPTIEKYEHHGVEVSVNSEFKGKHRDICLCYTCKHFKPKDRDNNCYMAQDHYDWVIENDLVAPIMECPEYEPGEDKRDI